MHAVTGMLIAHGAVQAWRLRWVCDDAFISFRYARNLARGHGLVWNLAERVEGYTNLLWTVAIAGGMRLGFDPVHFSWALGLAAWFVCCLLLHRLERRLSPVALPLGTWLFAVSPDVQAWATGGLETMPLAAVLCATALTAQAGSLWIAAILGAFAWWLHPDAILPAAVLLIGCALDRFGTSAARRSIGPLGLLGFCVLATTAWRLEYYGAWLPNTFYAKSAGEPWLSQGLWYLLIFLARNWAIALAVAFVAVRLAATAWRDPQARAGACVALGGASFVLYVVYSGGDFMQARRIVPALPLLLAPAGASLAGARNARLFAAVLVAGAALPWPIFARQPRIGGVADERAFYPAEVVEFRKAQGLELAHTVRGLDTPILIEGGLCMLAYYSDLDGVIEINGLTDARLSRQVLAERRIPGHEKRPTEEYLDERGVEIVVLHSPAPPDPPSNVAVLPQTGLALRLRHGVPAIVDALRARGALIEPRIRTRDGPG